MPVRCVTTGTSPYACKYDGENRTTAVIGVIRTTSTAGRGTPPQPANGFDTATTAFGAGHVFGLQIGGSDESYNIVPMWLKWQETGAWRQMEIAQTGRDGQIFHARLTYPAHSTNNRDANTVDFQSDQFISWTDSRIPDTISVNIHAAGTVAPGTLTDDLRFDAAIVALTAAAATATYGPFDIAAMPEEDRAYWQNQRIRLAADQLFSNYTSALPAASSPNLNEVTFLFHPETLPELRDSPQNDPRSGFTAPQAAGLQLNRVVSQVVNGFGKRRYKAESDKANNRYHPYDRSRSKSFS